MSSKGRAAPAVTGTSKGTATGGKGAGTSGKGAGSGAGRLGGTNGVMSSSGGRGAGTGKIVKKTGLGLADDDIMGDFD